MLKKGIFLGEEVGDGCNFRENVIKKLNMWVGSEIWVLVDKRFDIFGYLIGKRSDFFRILYTINMIFVKYCIDLYIANGQG